MEGEADDQIINDIARVLSGGAANAGAPEAPVEAAMEEEEDILDLTAELGGLEPVEEPMVAEVVEMVEMVAEAAPAEAVRGSRRRRSPEVFATGAGTPQVQAQAGPRRARASCAGRTAAADVGER